MQLLHPTAKTPTDIRRRNRFAVLSLLRQHGTLSKSELVRLTELTVTTIAAILDELVSEALVEVVDEVDHVPVAEIARGRPATQYRLNNHRWVVAGIQIASNSVTGAILNLSGEVLESASISAPSNMQPDIVLRYATDLIEGLIGRTLRYSLQLLGIGIALEGLVNVSAGLSLWMLFRDNWKDVQVAAPFEQYFGVPVLIDYRVYAAGLAEALYGAARGVSDFAYLNVDTGVAVAYVASGRMVRSSIGPTGLTGGLGHVLSTGGSRLCFCGKVGCLHTEITTQALLTQLKELVNVSQGSSIGQFWQTRDLKFDNLIIAGQQEDVLALQLRSRFAQNLGIAVSSAAQLFSGNMVIVGGVAVQFGGEEALEAARRAVQRLTILHRQFGLTKVVASSLLPDAATVGAATLIIQGVMEGQIAAPVA